MSESEAAFSFEDEKSSEQRPDPTMPGGIGIFFITLAILALLRIGLGYVTFPEKALLPINLLVTAIFMGAPILALFFAANANWKRSTALWFVGGGLVAHLGLYALDRQLTGGQGPISGVLGAISQSGLTVWCIGLGAALTTMIKDKNMLVPISVFLGFFDAFLVLTPVGFTQTIMKVSPKLLPTVAMQVPAAIANTAAQPPGGKATIGGYVGPADLVFLGMFFIALFRYGMKTRLTLTVMIPVLIAYMGVVGLFGLALPAMVPIGIVILIVNWNEIKLTKDELYATLGLTVICAVILAYAATRPKPKQQVEILTEPPAQEAGVPANSPATAGPGGPPSGPPTSQGSTQGPP